MSASPEVSGSLVTSRIDRPAKSSGPLEQRTELPRSSPVVIRAVALHKTGQRWRFALFSASLIDGTGFASVFIQLNEFSEGDRGNGDLGLCERI